MNRIKLLSLSLIFLFLAQGLDAETRRFRCMFSADPATTITVGFEQFNGSGNPFDDEGIAMFYYDTSPHGSNENDYAFSQSVDREIDYKGMENNFIRLTGLTPSTRYYFIVKDDQATSQVFFFETFLSSSRLLSSSHHPLPLCLPRMIPPRCCCCCCYQALSQANQRQYQELVIERDLSLVFFLSCLVQNLKKGFAQRVCSRICRYLPLSPF